MLSRLKMETVLGLIMIAAMAILATRGVQEAAAAAAPSWAAVTAEAGTGEPAAPAGTRKVIAVDAGHGGDDPGKIGVNNALEKDINLAIAGKLKQNLEAQGVKVIMIREDEKGLYDAGAANKKQDDMRKRCEKIDAADPEFTVSIHQNSYTSESVHGPQVFYYTHSQEGEAIAKSIQDALNTGLAVDRPREIKANDTYYLLKKTKKPTLIVECGFLSNNAEAAKLVTNEYQEQVAEAICDGVLKCLEK